MEDRSTRTGSEVGSRWVQQHSALIPRIRKSLLTAGEIHYRRLPWRDAPTPYGVFVAEMLLQKTNAATVEAVWVHFMDTWPTLGALAAANGPEVVDRLSRLGLAKRAHALHSAVVQMVEAGMSQPPRQYASLRALPGVGDYTACAVLSFAYNQPVPVVDANASRVYCRLSGYLPNTLRQGLACAREIAFEVVGEPDPTALNYAILDLSAALCRPRNPSCDACEMSGVCATAQATR